MRLRFSSDEIPLRFRKEAIEVAFGTHVRGVIDFAKRQPVAVTLQGRAIEGIHVARIDATPLRLYTPPDDSGLLYVSITTRGGGLIDATGESRTVRAGDVNVLRRNRHCTTVVAEPSRLLSIAMPRAQLVPRLADAGAGYTPNPRSRTAARLLENYAAMLLDAGFDLAPDEERIYARHIADLVALMLGATRDGAEHASRHGVRAARRQAIRADVAASLAVPELSVDWIAKRHKISSAYVRSLFSDKGTNFTDYVLQERLDAVRALLGSRFLAHHNIATLALMAGFGDISWFNQTFRRRFGTTPSDVRATALAHPV